MTKVVLVFEQDIFPPVLRYIGEEFEKHSTMSNTQFSPEIFALTDNSYELAKQEIKEIHKLVGYKSSDLIFRARPIVRISEL